MPITLQQIQEAEFQQTIAATDTNQQVRLIAGPGTGKSSVIEKRVLWLLEQQISPSNIFVISFTRASSKDLENRIHSYCVSNQYSAGNEINVSTLHSLALRALRQAGLLFYPGTPCILDDWELKNIIDYEFSSSSVYSSSHISEGYNPSRCKEIRQAYEAYCGTGIWNPANYIPPVPPISDIERNNYQSFHISRTLLYSCLLPGEIVQQCLLNMRAGTLNPANLLNIQHLVIDEYQDLNPVDIEFMDFLTANGVDTFIAGDDDQSIYSFRYASPIGIQQYHQRFPNVTHHSLEHCFRCAPNILNTAQPLINAYHDGYRIDKRLTSLYERAVPVVAGNVFRWQFHDDDQESRSIAVSISLLINNGMNPKDIMILISNTRIQLQKIENELTNFGIPFDSPREKSFFDSKPGRFILGLFRVICNPEDYLAFRPILGGRPNIGPSTCNSIASLASSNNLNYKNLFCNEIPNGIFSTRFRRIIEGARSIYSQISSWESDDTLRMRVTELSSIIHNNMNQTEFSYWENFISIFNPDTNLNEILDYINTENNEQKENFLESINFRLQLTQPIIQGSNNRVQIMTMHGAKGLSAKIVFIPGLENEVLPGNRRLPYPGQVNEAARMLYVSITRAKAACIISFAHKRWYYGSNSNQTPSQFVRYLNGRFDYRTSGLTNHEVEEIVDSCNNL